MKKKTQKRKKLWVTSTSSFGSWGGARGVVVWVLQPRSIDPKRTSETIISSRMFRMRFALGCRRCPRSFPNGAVSNVARQFGHLGFSYRRNAFSNTSWPQSRWKQWPHAWSINTTSAPGPGNGRGSMHTVHSSGPSTWDRVWQHPTEGWGVMTQSVSPTRGETLAFLTFLMGLSTSRAWRNPQASTKTYLASDGAVSRKASGDPLTLAPRGACGKGPA